MINQSDCRIYASCGIIAILWRKNFDCFLSRVKLPFHFDRIMMVRLDFPGANPVFVINVYLPTTNRTICEYSNCIHDLQILIEWISDLGTFTICGDFNGQFSSNKGTCSN